MYKTKFYVVNKLTLWVQMVQT